MCAFFRKYHTNLEVRGGKDKDGNEVESLKDRAYTYIQSTTLENLDTNREALYSRLKDSAAKYIKET